MKYPKEIIFDTVEILETICPKSILIIGDSLQSIAENYQQQCNIINQECIITNISAGEDLSHPAYSQRYDLAIVGEAIETKQKLHSEQLIGRLRDLCTPKIILLAHLNQDVWKVSDLYGFGFATHAKYKQKNLQSNALESTVNEGLHLLHYNIDSYKKTPDWFNPKNWAHPELWNKFWW